MKKMSIDHFFSRMNLKGHICLYMVKRVLIIIMNNKHFWGSISISFNSDLTENRPSTQVKEICKLCQIKFGILFFQAFLHESGFFKDILTNIEKTIVSHDSSPLITVDVVQPEIFAVLLEFLYTESIPVRFLYVGP